MYYYYSAAAAAAAAAAAVWVYVLHREWSGSKMNQKSKYNEPVFLVLRVSECIV